MKKIILAVALGLGSQLVFAARTVAVNTQKSNIKWTGKKVSGKHFGSVKFNSGKISFDNKGVLTSADFKVDMRTINTEDISGEWKDKLDIHLKDGDFFNVKTHKFASLKLQKVLSKKGNTYHVQSNLTIKGKTLPVKFKVTIAGDKSKKLTGKLNFDRTKFGIKYGSGSFFKGLGDKMILDDVELDFNVVAN